MNRLNFLKSLLFLPVAGKVLMQSKFSLSRMTLMSSSEVGVLRNTNTIFPFDGYKFYSYYVKEEDSEITKERMRSFFENTNDSSIPFQPGY